MNELVGNSAHEQRHLVIYDGDCRFCHGAVHFIIQRDPTGLFVFTPMQTDVAKALLAQHQIHNMGVDSLVLIKHGQYLINSTAALEIAKDLTGFWYLFGIFRWVPVNIRDDCYQLFARNRYRLFGRRDSCLLPDEQLKDRFLGL